MNFKHYENFEVILSKHLKNIINIKGLNTGWTNIVFEITTDKGEYIARFPRGSFWSKMIIKEYNLCKFLENKISFKIPELKLLYDRRRPFTIHEKIKGKSLESVMNKLKENEISEISKEIASFINEMNSIESNALPNACKVSLFDFLNELSDLHFKNKEIWDPSFFKNNDDLDYLVHGDLNPGNIIVNDNNEIVAIIDFCFSGPGNIYSDISRIVGRINSKFKKHIIKAYEEYSNQKVDDEILNKYIDIWSKIDLSYVEFIRNNNPEIELPLHLR